MIQQTEKAEATKDFLFGRKATVKPFLYMVELRRRTYCRPEKGVETSCRTLESSNLNY